MRPPLDLGLPRSRDARRWRPLALAVSVGLHVALFLFGAVDVWVLRLPEPVARPEATTLDTVPFVVFRTPLPEPRPPTLPRTRKPPVQRPDVPVVAAQPEPPPPAPNPPVPETRDTGGAPAAPAPQPAQPAPPAPIARIGPELGNGKLWVQPLPLPPRELARRLNRGHADLIDSAVTAIVQNFLDSVASDPSSRGVPMPDWTTRVAGKKFGLDSTSVYIAGLKIPAAVLALLPIPAGNIDQNKAYNRLLELRADIEQAARRADNLSEFKERIKEIRLRKEREEEFERRRKEAPPAAPSRDSVSSQPPAQAQRQSK